MDKLIIIDGNSLVNRAFYALPMLANFEGVVSNAVFGFTNMLVKVINEIKPKYICVAFDYGKKTFRNEMFKDYKATRKPTPQELVLQFPILKTVLNAMQIKLIEIEGVEADDIIGSLTKKFDVENIILTGDKDAFQLVNSNTSVMFTKKGISETIECNVNNVKEIYGVDANQVIDLKALMGDSSDNIPGVVGVGEKTALTLLGKYVSLDGVYENINEITGKLKENLINNKEIAYLSRDLATIKCDVPLNYELEEFTYEFPFEKDVYELFEKYQFNSLLKRKELFLNATPGNESLFEDKIVEVKTEKKLLELIEKLSSENLVYLYIDEVLSVATKEKEYVINFNQDLFNTGLEISFVMNALKPILENSKIEKVVYDYKKTLHTLDKYNILLTGVVFDILIARYLINNNAKAKVTFNEVLTEHGLSSSARAFNIKELYTRFSQKINELELNKLFYEIEMPLAKVLFEMEKAGFKVDLNELNVLEEENLNKINTLTSEIHEIVGHEFNINSPKQLGEVLFNELGIKAFNNKKNSTNIDVLNEIYDQHIIVPKLIEYRKVTKLYTTYIKAFKELVNKNTNKIHTIFNQTLTSTGRLSSEEPNLQNIPIRRDDGRLLRKIFIPSFDNGYILTADYSQIELRLLANFSGDEKLIDAFNNGIDIHTKTASEIFKVPFENVTEEQRRNAKAINFGIIYGISDYGLSQNINSTRVQAMEYISNYFENYPKVKAFMDNNIQHCKHHGFVKTYFGRIRYILEINSANYNMRQFGERAAMNMPLQGTASDVIKFAMVKINDEIKKRGLKSKLILQIHDELLFDCEENELDILKKIIPEIMESIINLPVKLTVNVESGRNWYEA